MYIEFENDQREGFMPSLIFCPGRDSKGRPDRREGIKQSGGLFYRPWESPLNPRRIRYGCELDLNYKFSEISFGISSFISCFAREGTRKIKCNADERCPLRLDAAEHLFSPKAKMQTSPFRC